MIDINDVDKGTKIIVGPSIANTHRRFNSCSEMHDMKGKMFEVAGVNRSDDNVSFEGFTWDVRDLELPVVEEPEPVIVHFDTKHL